MHVFLRFFLACHWNDELDIRWLQAGLTAPALPLVSLSHGPATSRDNASDKSHD